MVLDAGPVIVKRSIPDSLRNPKLNSEPLFRAALAMSCLPQPIYIYIYLGLESLGWLLAMLCSKTALGKLEKHYSSDCFELLVVY
jgi:hypothetical protein